MSTTDKFAVFYFPNNSRTHKQGPMASTMEAATEKFIEKFSPEEVGRVSLGRRPMTTGVFLVHEDREAVTRLKEAGFFISHAQSGR